MYLSDIYFSEKVNKRNCMFCFKMKNLKLENVIRYCWKFLKCNFNSKFENVIPMKNHEEGVLQQRTTYGNAISPKKINIFE